MEHKDTEQKYDLYTEKIVLSPKVKYKNLIRTIKILILIIREDCQLLSLIADI